MVIFEDKNHKGPLGEILEECKKYRVESIYNTKYKYIKAIIWDEQYQEHFGDSREGYEKWKNTSKYSKDTITNLQYSNENCIRELSDYKTGEPLEYIMEIKQTSNQNLNELFKLYEKAEEEFYKILKVNSYVTFNYWLKDQIHQSMNIEANDIISRIEKLEDIINEYNEDEEFKSFIDKIKE